MAYGSCKSVRMPSFSGKHCEGTEAKKPRRCERSLRQSDAPYQIRASGIGAKFLQPGIDSQVDELGIMIHKCLLEPIKTPICFVQHLAQQCKVTGGNVTLFFQDLELFQKMDCVFF